MIHLKTVLDQRRTRKDGTHPIVFRITLKGKSRDISSGLACSFMDWDQKNQSVRERSAQHEQLAKHLRDKQLQLLERIRLHERTYPFATDIKEAKAFLCAENVQNITVKAFWEQEIERLRRSRRYSGANTYEGALRGLSKSADLDVTFQQVNFNWLLQAETELRARGMSVNSVGVYFRTLRAVYNRAINMDLIDASSYPFRRYKIKTGLTSPRNLSLEEMKRFMSHTPSSDRLRHAHNMGKLMFMLRGINYADLTVLTKSNYRNGRISYHRSKTGKPYSIQVLPCAHSLIEEYSTNHPDLLLSLLTPEQYQNKARLPEVITQSRSVLNKWLRRLGEQIGLEEPLSTYVFRYSHAGICRELGYSKDMISQSLGHQNGLRVTDAYLNDYDEKLIDAMNKAVVQEVL